MKHLLAGIIALLFFGTNILAQDKSELDMIRDMWKSEKKDLVKQFMALDEIHGAKFWPVYEDYSVERSKLASDRINAIESYGKNYAGLTNEQADALVKDFMKNDKANLKLQKKYYKKMKKAVGALKAAQFLQVETYFQTMIRAEVQDAIPFIGEIDRKKG